MPNERRHIVIGGGVIGVCVAYYLVKRGAHVTLLEKDRIGHGASFGNAGAIAVGHAPINKPGRVRQALKSMFDPVGPLYIKPRMDPDLIRWLWVFRRYCSEGRFRKSLELMGALGHRTGDLFARLVDEEGLSCNYTPNGYYEVYKTEAALSAARRDAAITALHGYHPENVSGDALREREPAIREDVIGGVYFKDSATIDPYRFVAGLADAVRKHGATIQEHVEVDRIEFGNGAVTGVRTIDGEGLSADAVIVAAGAYSHILTRSLGISLPLQAAKGYHSDRALSTGGTPDLKITFMLGERSVYCTPMGSFVRLAGTLEFSGLNHDIRQQRLAQLTKSALQYVKGIEDVRASSEWCGLRPCLPDGYPAVGPVPGVEGLYLATGHAMMGLTLGPITGQLLAEAILDGKPSMDISAFGTDRFS